MANGKNSVALQRHNTITTSVPPSSSGASLTDGQQPQSRFASPFSKHADGYLRMQDNAQKPRQEEDEDDDECSWGLERGMRLFEVSAKDDRGLW